MDLGPIGNAMMTSKHYESYVIKEEALEKGKCVVYAKWCRLIFNQPLPEYEVTEKKVKVKKRLTLQDALQALGKIDTAIGILSQEYEWPNKRGSWLNVFVIGNGADNAGVEPNASAFSNSTHLYMSVPLVKDHALTGFYTTIVHELGHVFTNPGLLFSQEWGPGISESFSCFFEGYYIPCNTRYYGCIDVCYSMDTNVHLNPYGQAGLMYRDFKNFRGYNGSFWIFIVERYGIAAFKRLVKEGIMKKIMTTYSLFPGVADYLRVDTKTLASQWLGDIMTASFYRKDPIRLSFATKFLANKKCFNANLIWKQSQHDLLQVSSRSGGVFEGIMVDKKLEAFAFATFDLYTIYADILKATVTTSLNISISTQDSPTPDTTWLMVLVTGPNSVTTYTTNIATITAIPKQRPFMLGIMHTDTRNIALNDTSKSAKSYKIRIEAK